MGLLDLPRELRDLIYQNVIVKDNNTITMLPLGNSGHDVSACTPTLCAVSRQIRQETIPSFYGLNVFSAQLDNESDLMVAKCWLAAIGEENIRHLRRLSFRGWTRVPFKHFSCRMWLKVVFDLKKGTVELENGVEHMSGMENPTLCASLEQVRAAYKKVFQACLGKTFDARSIERMMHEFNSVCPGY